MLVSNYRTVSFSAECSLESNTAASGCLEALRRRRQSWVHEALSPKKREGIEIRNCPMERTYTEGNEQPIQMIRGTPRPPEAKRNTAREKTPELQRLAEINFTRINQLTEAVKQRPVSRVMPSLERTHDLVQNRIGSTNHLLQANTQQNLNDTNINDVNRYHRNNFNDNSIPAFNHTDYSVASRSPINSFNNKPRTQSTISNTQSTWMSGFPSYPSSSFQELSLHGKVFERPSPYDIQKNTIEAFTSSLSSLSHPRYPYHNLPTYYSSTSS